MNPLGHSIGSLIVHCWTHHDKLFSLARVCACLTRCLVWVDPQAQGTFPLVNPGVSQLCVREDGKILASAGWDHRVRVFGWKRLKPLAVLQHHTDMVLSVAFSDHQDPTHRLLAAGSKDRRISLWSIYNDASHTG